MTNRWFRKFFGLQEDETPVSNVVIKYIQNRKCYFVKGEWKPVWTVAECASKLEKFQREEVKDRNDWIAFWTRSSNWVAATEDESDQAWRQDCHDKLEREFEKIENPDKAPEVDLFGDMT